MSGLYDSFADFCAQSYPGRNPEGHEQCSKKRVPRGGELITVQHTSSSGIQVDGTIRCDRCGTILPGHISPVVDQVAISSLPFPGS